MCPAPTIPIFIRLFYRSCETSVPASDQVLSLLTYPPYAITKTLGGVAALGALALGGSALEVTAVNQMGGHP